MHCKLLQVLVTNCEIAFDKIPIGLEEFSNAFEAKQRDETPVVVVVCSDVSCIFLNIEQLK